MHTIAQFIQGLGAAPYKMWHVLTLMEEAEIGMKMCGSTFLNKIGYCLFSRTLRFALADDLSGLIFFTIFISEFIHAT